jgi:hypothetical protein
MDIRSALFIAGSAFGAAILYKTLFAGEKKSETKENTSVLPEAFDFYGDDAQTFIMGFHAENRLGPTKARLVNVGPPDEDGHPTGVANVIINNAVFQAEPSLLIASQTSEPPVQFVSEYF